MKRLTINLKICFFLFTVILLAGCKPGSVNVKGFDCKMNGSFETIKDGLPVNWWYYAMETVPKGDFDILIDSTVVRDGTKSLKFQVRSCLPTGGWHSPGFFEEFKVQPGKTYKVSFWIINEGCDLIVKVGAGMKGNPGPSEVLLRTKESFADWTNFEYNFEIPLANDNLRFEANILTPGTIWFDDIRIEGLNDKRELNLYPYRGYEECK